MSGALCLMFGQESLEVTVTPPGADGIGGTNRITSNVVTVSVSLGTATAWSWIRLSGDDITALNPSSASTDFQSPLMASGTTVEAVFVCDVTVNGSIYRSPEVPVHLERT